MVTRYFIRCGPGLRWREVDSYRFEVDYQAACLLTVCYEGWAFLCIEQQATPAAGGVQ